jgi:hypothetical protein
MRAGLQSSPDLESYFRPRRSLGPAAVLSVGGFLGMGSKYVEVSYSDLTFGNTQKDGDNRVVLKGATKESLKGQPAYEYYKS